MTIFAFGLCGLGAIGSWKIIADTSPTVPKGQMISIYISAGLYTLGALISLFGFIGAIIRKRSLISIYATALAFHLGFHIVSGAYALYVLFKRKNTQEVADCVAKADTATHLDSNKVTKEVCEKAFAVARGISVAAFILVVLIELYACIIASNYASQLEEEETANPKYQPATTYGNQYPFAASNAALVGNRSHV
jgi:hypothetical protein